MVQRVDVQYVQFYTAGSAARRIMPARVNQTATLPQIKKKKVHRIHVDPVAVLGTVVAVCMLIMMAVGVSQLRVEQQRVQTMEAYVAQLQAENTALQEKYAEQCDLEAVEKTALALGMIPQQEAVCTSIQVELPQQTQRAGLWQQIGTFLASIFA